MVSNAADRKSLDIVLLRCIRHISVNYAGPTFLGGVQPMLELIVGRVEILPLGRFAHFSRSVLPPDNSEILNGRERYARYRADGILHDG